MANRNIRHMTRAALFAALLAACAWISLPVGDIGFTLQTFGVFLTLGVLGGNWGTVSILIYLLLGGIGLPVFSGFRGGLGMLLGVTGGYLWGFVAAGLVYWALERVAKPLAMALGMAACYICGSLWFTLYSGGGIGLVFLRCVVPYLIPDAAKIWLAYSLSRRLHRHIT